MLKRFLILFAMSLFCLEAQAVAVDKPLDDPKLEQRARDLHKQLRCLVCQNQSIEDSNADLARDLRVVVREQIALGKSDAEVVAYLVERYGDWVLLEPPLKTGTIALWAGPAVILFFAILFIAVRRQRRAGMVPAHAAPLSEQEKAELDALLKSSEDGERG